MSDQNFVYVGWYKTDIPFPDLQDNLQLIKKVGKTINLSSREKQLSGTQDYLIFKYIKAWEVDKKNIEKAIHNLLHNERAGKTEWFYDEENNLVQRLSDFMSTLGYQEHGFDNNEDLDEDENLLEKLKSNISFLDGETFTANHTDENKEKVSFSVTVGKKDDDITFYSHNIGDYVSGTFHNAFRQSVEYYNKENSSNITHSRNVWRLPKNKSGKSPYEVIADKMGIKLPKNIFGGNR